MSLKSPLKLLNWLLEIITKNIAPKLFFYRSLVGQHKTVQNGVPFYLFFLLSFFPFGMNVRIFVSQATLDTYIV